MNPYTRIGYSNQSQSSDRPPPLRTYGTESTGKTKRRNPYTTVGFGVNQKASGNQAASVVNEMLDKGLSFEDIAKATGIDVGSIREFTKSARPDYGVQKKPSKSLLEQGGDFGQGLIDRVGGGLIRGGIRLGALISEPLPGEQRKAAEEFIQKYAENNPNIETKGGGSVSNPFAYDETSAGGRTGRFIGTGISAGTQLAGIGKAGSLARGVVPGTSRIARAGKFGAGSLAETGAVATTTTAQGNDINLPREAGVGLLADLALRGGGRALRGIQSANTARKASQGAQKADDALSQALSKVDNIDPELEKQLRSTFSKQTGDTVTTVASRQGSQTSRAKQFADTAEKEVIEALENDPVIARSGQVQTQAETLATATQRGPIDLTSVKVGEKVDAVDVARARLSMTNYLDDYKQAVMSRDPKKIKKSYEQLKKAREGYQVITSEPGRALQIQGTFDDKMVKVFDTLADYQKTITEGKSLTKGQTDYLNKLLGDTIEAMQPPKTGGLKNWVYAGDTSLVRKLEEYATAAKLTSPTTHLRNVIGNTMTFTQRAIDQGAGGLIGAMTGRTSIRAVPKVLGTRNGYKTATLKGWDILKDSLLLRESTADSVDRLAREGYRETIGGKTGRFIRLPFKMLEAADEFGKTVLRDSRLNQEAFEIATKEGFKGKLLVKRVDELVRNPTQSMLKSADDDALLHTFQNPLGKAGSKAQEMINAIPGGKFFIPFIRTPTNIVKFQASRSILGAPGQVAKAVTKRGTREGDEAIARAFTGTMLSVGTVAWVADNRDLITGAAPSTQAERDAFYASGKQPFAIKIGNKWVSYQGIQPLGLYLLHATAFDDAVAQSDDTSAGALAANMATIAGQGVLELPFVSGMSNIMEALTDPDYQGERFVANVLRGFVPNALRDVRLYTDEIIRAPDSIKEQIFDMIPGLSEQVSPRRNIIGEQITRAGTPTERSIGRIFGTPEQETPELLGLLAMVTEDTGYSPGRNWKKQRGVELDDEQMEVFNTVQGQKLSELLRADLNKINDANPEEKEKVVKGLVAQSREYARDFMDLKRPPSLPKQ